MGQRGDGESRLGLKLQPDSFAGNMGNIPSALTVKTQGGHDQRYLVSHQVQPDSKCTAVSRGNHRMVWVGRDFKDLVPAPCHAQGHLPGTIWTQAVTSESSEGSALCPGVPRAHRGCSAPQGTQHITVLWRIHTHHAGKGSLVSFVFPSQGFPWNAPTAFPLSTSRAICAVRIMSLFGSQASTGRHQHPHGCH